MLNFLAPLISWGGMGVLIVLGAVAAAFFLPLKFRQLALMVAVGAAAATGFYWKGDQDGSARIQSKWDAAISKAIEKGNEARSDAESDAADGRLPDNDPYNRDR